MANPDLATSGTRSGALVEAVGGIAPIAGSGSRYLHWDAGAARAPL